MRMNLAPLFMWLAWMAGKYEDLLSEWIGIEGRWAGLLVFCSLIILWLAYETYRLKIRR